MTHFTVQPRLTQYCKAIILQSKIVNATRKGEKGGKEVLGCNIQHDEYNEHCCTLYMKVIRRVNPKYPHDKEKYFFCFLNFVPMWDDGSSLVSRIIL